MTARSRRMPTPTSPESPIAVRLVALSALVRWPRNPKDHDLGALGESLQRFGYVNPILVNATNHTILAGHGRLDALWQRFTAGGSPPDRVVIESANGDPDWIVPIVEITVPEDQHEAYVVADNRIAELGGWHKDKLFEVLRDLSMTSGLDGTGYDGDDVDNLAFLFDPGSAVTRGTLPTVGDTNDGVSLGRLRVVISFEDAAEVDAFFAAFEHGPAVRRPNKLVYGYRELTAGVL